MFKIQQKLAGNYQEEKCPNKIAIDDISNFSVAIENRLQASWNKERYIEENSKCLRKINRDAAEMVGNTNLNNTEKYSKQTLK